MTASQRPKRNLVVGLLASIIALLGALAWQYVVGRRVQPIDSGVSSVPQREKSPAPKVDPLPASAVKSGTQTDRPVSPSVSLLKAAFLRPSDAVIVDIRPREEFRQLQIEGSVNIPRDELVIRLLPEVDLTKKLFLFCHCVTCQRAAPSLAAEDYCQRSLEQMKALGAAEATPIDATLADLKLAGVPLVSDSRR